MEEKNTALMQTNVSLEEDLRKANAAKAQLETYKRQVRNQQPCRVGQFSLLSFIFYFLIEKGNVFC